MIHHIQRPDIEGMRTKALDTAQRMMKRQEERNIERGHEPGRRTAGKPAILIPIAEFLELLDYIEELEK